MRIVVRIFAIIGVLSTLFTIIVASLLFWIGSRVESSMAGAERPAVRVADSTVLTIDLEQPFAEAMPQGFDFVFGDGSTPFEGLIGGLQRATSDPRVKGLVVRAGSVRLGLAQAQEFRDIVKAFRAKGKFAYAFGDSFGEISGGTHSYYVASAFDEVWLQPAGSLALTGVASEVPFFRGTFDKLGITPQFERRGEFKTAAAEFTETKMPDSDKQAMDEMVHSLFDQLVQGIGEGRKIAVPDVKALVDGGPYTGDEALAKHLVDHLGYLDELEDAARKKAGGAETLALQAYLQLSASSPFSAPESSVALIRAVGTISGGSSDDNPFQDSGKAGADTIARAFDEAVRDPSVKAILFRIESPGGSEVASETIWRAVKRAQQAGKPVIVSMADVAASGGYYIAAPADKIVAEPMTLTGSIGVFSGKFVLAGLWDKLGVSWDSVSAGRNAEMGGSLAPFTPEQRQRFVTLTDVAYKSFLTRVADGRHMPTTAVDAIARGRVWTGVQAKEHGLVDELGGIDAAFRLAKQAAHLGDQLVAVKNFPHRRSPIQTLVKGLAGADGAGQALAALDRLAALEPVLRRLEAVTPAVGDVTMRPIDLRD